MVKCKYYFVVVVGYLLCSMYNNVLAQTINLSIEQEIIRVKQLTDSGYVTMSNTIQPVVLSNKKLVQDKNKKNILNFYQSSEEDNRNKNLFFSFTPLVVSQQYNTNYPYATNDGFMIAARGYQVYASVGFKAHYGPLHVQLNPEMVWAQNNNFDTLATKFINTSVGSRYYALKHFTDNPELYPGGSYKKIGWGQSSISLEYRHLAVAVSNENIWWGPGIYNSLIMSNNAPGFLHASFHTAKPIHTSIGNFEWQLISGITESSSATIAKGYLNGLVISYQPFHFKGLYVGFIRAFNQFQVTAQKYHDYFPVFGNLFRSKDKVIDDSLYRDQIASVFFRYVLPKSGFEIYGEYGREDASYNIRDFLMTPNHSRAFIVGLQKLYTLPMQQYLKLGIEVTQEQQPADYLVRDSGPWYLNYQVTRGWTNNGKVLGASIGPGSNSRNFTLQWIKQSNWLGIELIQIERNNDFYNEIFYNTVDNRKWTDYIIGINGNTLYGKNKKILINFSVDYILSKNAHWLLNTYAPGDINATTAYTGNWHLKINTVYRF